MELFECYHFQSGRLPRNGSRAVNKCKMEQTEVWRLSSVVFMEDKNF